ncbi:MAG: hypothetical protein IPH53_18050 [Flavobacteriales bacterium]|nr:hypothetical protein [Flavobacteriales bacterium]
MLVSCSGLKHATPERPLFAGFDLEWDQPPVEERKAHDPRTRCRGTAGTEQQHPGLATYGRLAQRRSRNRVKPKGLRNLLKNKIGSAPVYLADVPLKDINAAFENRMNNHGYFAASSRYEEKTSGRRARVVFFTSRRHTPPSANITYADSTDTLNTRIAGAAELTPGSGTGVRPGPIGQGARSRGRHIAEYGMVLPEE